MDNTSSQSTSPSSSTCGWPPGYVNIFSELRKQTALALPLVAMNLTSFAKLAITTAFLGRLGDLQLAGGSLGLTFANVTGFSVLSGLTGAMEPICGQANGAGNTKLLRKTLFMTITLLLMVSIPISMLWVNVDRILISFGQQKDMSVVAKNYLLYLLPHLVVTSLLCPLKSYLSSQSITFPTLLSSAIALAVHIPINIVLAKTKGLQGVSMAVWISDLMVVVFLGLYVVKTESNGGNWKLNQGLGSASDWLALLKLCGPCCLTTCLEWWCFEILTLLTGRLPNAKQAVGVLVIILNFDYLLYSVMISLATCVSVRVSNALGANQPGLAYRAASLSLALSTLSGFIGGLVMVGARGVWGRLFSHDKGIIQSVKHMMLLMALVEVVNFPVVVCGGIFRGTARPWVGVYANISGFYLVALPLGVVLAFKKNLGLSGLLTGFLVGMGLCLILLAVFVMRIDWEKEAVKAQILALAYGMDTSTDRELHGRMLFPFLAFSRQQDKLQKMNTEPS